LSRIPDRATIVLRHRAGTGLAGDLTGRLARAAVLVPTKDAQGFDAEGLTNNVGPRSIGFIAPPASSIRWESAYLALRTAQPQSRVGEFNGRSTRGEWCIARRPLFKI
jgi:hypothetical protein